VQLGLRCQLSAEQYVARQSWLNASLPSCPVHPKGGCGFARHGTYGRREPTGARVARYYCRTGKITFSLLPDCLASRLSATLQRVESAVVLVELAGSPGAAARQMHPFTGEVDRVQGDERRLRRWRRDLCAALVSLSGLMPEKLGGHPATLLGWRTALGTVPALVALRGEAAPFLGSLPPPFGFGPRPIPRRRTAARSQHKVGPDPPLPSV
jgi:hypothetical protein